MTEDEIKSILRGYQIHIHDRGDYWEAVITTTPKMSFYLLQKDFSYTEMKRLARETFAEWLGR